MGDSRYEKSMAWHQVLVFSWILTEHRLQSATRRATQSSMDPEDWVSVLPVHWNSRTMFTWDCHVLLLNMPFYHDEMPFPPWQYTCHENYFGLYYYSVVQGGMTRWGHEAGSGLLESSVVRSGPWKRGCVLSENSSRYTLINMHCFVCVLVFNNVFICF